MKIIKATQQINAGANDCFKRKEIIARAALHLATPVVSLTCTEVQKSAKLKIK